jgi:hypothetical protein
VRLVHQQAERDKRQPPKYLVGQIALVVQAEKLGGECVALRFVECAQEIAATREEQGGSIVDCIEKDYRDWYQATQDHHQHSEALVHSLKQTIEGQRNEDPPAQMVRDRWLLPMPTAKAKSPVTSTYKRLKPQVTTRTSFPAAASIRCERSNAGGRALRGLGSFVFSHGTT